MNFPYLRMLLQRVDAALEALEAGGETSKVMSPVDDAIPADAGPASHMRMGTNGRIL